MDINSLLPDLAETGAVMQVRNPVNGKPIEGMSITFYGPTSSVFKARQSEKRKETAEIARKLADKEITEEDAAEWAAKSDATDLAVLTKCWQTSDDDPTLTMNGEALECTRENAMKVYLGNHVIKDQATAYVNRAGNWYSVKPPM